MRAENAWRSTTIRTCGIAVALLLSSIGVAAAQPRTVSIVIDKMDRPACPVTLKKALMKEPGVSAVTVHYDQKRLDVGFDDTKATADAILKTIAGLGFPGRVVR